MSGRTILIVDDDNDLLRLLSMRLTAAGYNVVAVDEGQKALVQLSACRPQLMITDLRMPGMDGMALFDTVHKCSPSLPVMILTAHGSIPDAIAATKRGVFGFLTKPFDSRDLLAQVEKAVRLSGAAEHHGEGDENVWRKRIVTRSPAMNELLAQAWLIAQSDSSVFIHGQSGAGKELLARAIHDASPRSAKAFIAVNCAAIPEQLLESELFGYSKGSFTGATKDYEGLLLAADQGTLFLDEIGDMPASLQAKLLRVLQEKSVRPVGSTKTIAIDVRIISATHREIEKEMQAGTFREDLYYRLNVVTLEIPSLAERREDIPLLASHFLAELAEKYQRPGKLFAPDAMELLLSAPLPGNVRQLRNVVEQSFALCTTAIIPLSLVKKALRDKHDNIPSLIDAKKGFERDYLLMLLRMTGGNVTQAARLAKRNRTDFYKLLHRHHVDPGVFKRISE